MAWQKAVAQTEPVTFYSGGVPTAPTGALSATISKDGAGFGAVGGSIVQTGATPSALLTLDVDDMDCDAGVVRLVDAGGAVDDRCVEFVTEANYTAAKAALIEAMRGTDSAALATAWTPARAAYLDMAISDIPAGSGSIILSASSRTITIEGGEAVNGNGDIEITRDDDTDIRFTWSDEDITGCTIYLTVRENMSSTSADDDDAVFQVVADLTTPESGIFTFSIGKDETDAADIDTRYWYDIQSIDENGKVTTILKKVRLTVSGDVTRRTS